MGPALGSALGSACVEGVLVLGPMDELGRWMGGLRVEYEWEGSARGDTRPTGGWQGDSLLTSTATA